MSKIVSGSKLNRLWKNGILPIINRVAALENTSSTVENKITTYDDMMANTVEGYIPDALAVKEGFSNINSSLKQTPITIGDETMNTIDEKLNYLVEGIYSRKVFSGTSICTKDEIKEIDTGLENISKFFLYTSDIGNTRMLITQYDSVLPSKYRCISYIGSIYNYVKNIGERSTNNYSILDINGGKVKIQAVEGLPSGACDDWNSITWIAMQ